MIKKITLSVIVALLFGASAFAQKSQISGTVTEKDGSPVIGATVMIDGTHTGTQTDANGNYTLKLPEGMHGTLLFSCIGYKSQLIDPEGKTVLNVILEVDTSMLDELVVVAFGTTTKEAFTGSASVVKSEDLAKRQVSSVTQALAGAAAGVQVTSSSGDPSASPSILIRGVSSMYASQGPLYVVDGVPYTAAIANLNPADIESMTVLKDAASTALYGSRGANGVILITTKRAKAGEATVSFDAKWGVNSLGTPLYETIDDPAQYYELWYGALNSYYLNNGLAPNAAHIRANETLVSSNPGGLGYQVYTVPDGEYFIGTNGKVNPNASLGRTVHYNGEDYYLYPDDYKEGYLNTLRQEYNLSMSASNDRASVYASMGFLDNNGIVANSNYKRYTGRLRAEYQAKNWLRIGGNMAYTHYDSTYPSESSTANSSNSFYFMNTMAPIYPLYVRDGNGNIKYDEHGYKVYDYGNGMNAGSIRTNYANANALQALQLDTYSRNGNAMNSTAFADIQFCKDLTATFNIGTNFTEYRTNSTRNQYYGQFASSGGTIGVSNSRRMEINAQQLLNYNHTFADKHKVSVMLGHEFYKRNYYYLYAAKTNRFSLDNNELNGAIIDNKSASSYRTDYNNEGYLARAEYQYDNRITLSGSFRRDASSRFHPDHRWGNFWSLSAAWLMNHESWFNADWVDMLKLKASVGSQGNDGIDDWLYTDFYDVEESDGQISTQFYLKGNENITWETNTNINVGADFEFFRGRIGGTVEYFNRRTTDMLNWFSVPGSLGYSGYWDNIGDMSNAGVEVDLHFTPVQTKNVTWNIGFNLAHYDNKITRIADANKTTVIEGYEGYIYGTSYIGEGLPYYTWYMPSYAGVDPTTGVSMWYKDAEDGTRTTTTNSSEATYYIQDTSLPDLYGGITTSIDFFGFDFSASMAYQIGGLSYDYGYSAFMSSPYGTSGGYNLHVDILNSWTPENPSQDIPRFMYGDYSSIATSNRFLTDASYLSISNVTLGYTLPTRLTEKINVHQIRIYFAADNLAFWSRRKGFDPRYSYAGGTSYYNYSPIRTISGGISLKF